MLLLSIRVNNKHSRINIRLGPGLFARIKDTIVKKCKCCGKNKPEDENAEKPAVQELKPKKKSGKVHRPFSKSISLYRTCPATLYSTQNIAVEAGLYLRSHSTLF